MIKLPMMVAKINNASLPIMSLTNATITPRKLKHCAKLKNNLYILFISNKPDNSKNTSQSQSHCHANSPDVPI